MKAIIDKTDEINYLELILNDSELNAIHEGKGVERIFDEGWDKKELSIFIRR